MPEAIEMRAQRLDALRVDLVDATVSFGPIEHEVGALEYCEVLRDRGPRHGKMPGELAHRHRPAQELLDDRAAGRVAEGVELRMSLKTVSHCLR